MSIWDDDTVVTSSRCRRRKLDYLRNSSSLAALSLMYPYPYRICICDTELQSFLISIVTRVPNLHYLGLVCQPVKFHVRLPLPVGHAFELPSEVAQLAVLEQRGASRLMRVALEVGRAVDFYRKPVAISQSDERVDGVPGSLVTMLFLYMRTA